MKILLLMPLICISCSVAKTSKPVKEIKARVTYYHKHEDKWGDHVAVSPRIKNKAGFGVAAHPDFPFWTKIRIPELNRVFDGDDEFTVIDRGSAVTKKVASRGRCYVFDVYTPFTGKQFERFVDKQNSYTTVIIP